MKTIRKKLQFRVQIVIKFDEINKIYLNIQIYKTFSHIKTLNFFVSLF